MNDPAPGTINRPLDCPRCGSPIPNPDHAGEFPGALSRWDGTTEVCSHCGAAEAMLQFNANLAAGGLDAGRLAAEQIVHPTLGSQPWAILRDRNLRDYYHRLANWRQNQPDEEVMVQYHDGRGWLDLHLMPRPDAERWCALRPMDRRIKS